LTKAKVGKSPTKVFIGSCRHNAKTTPLNQFAFFFEKKSIWLSYVRGIELVDGLKNFNPKYLNFQLSVCVFLESTFYGEMAG
jgi:hypothetical protein